MHKHLDYPELDGGQQRRLVAGGLDRIWVRPEVDSSAVRANEGARTVLGPAQLGAAS
jgi:hypothetical protein